MQLWRFLHPSALAFTLRTTSQALIDRLKGAPPRTTQAAQYVARHARAGDPAAGDDGVDAFDVGLPHTAGADHADPKSHRRVTLLLLLEAEAEGREVLAGLDGVGERVVLGAAVHVLLADDIELFVEVGERLDELTHVGQTGRRGD